MTWILSISDLSLLSIVTAEQVLEEMPCEIYIQMPTDFLSDRNLEAITTDQYWFGPDGECKYNASQVLDCSDPNRTVANFTTEELQCFYPFVPSNYKTPITELYEAGFENCGIACDFYPYLGDVKKLDDFNHAASVLALIFGIGFFVNVSFEVYKACKSKTKFGRLPLSFDIPVIIACWLMVFTIILLIPSWGGKEYFACETGTDAIIAGKTHKANINCYIAGQFMMCAISSMYLYCSLLSFSIWRSLTNPWKPLFGIHKIWFHIALNIVVLGYYISAVNEDIFGAINVSGVCGPNIEGDTGMRYLFIPLMFDIITFIIFTGLTIYKLITHYKNQQKHSAAEKAIFNLAVRMGMFRTSNMLQSVFNFAL